MKFHTFRVMLAALGMSKTAPAIEIPGYAIIAAQSLQRVIGETIITEQERAEFGCPTPRKREMEV